MNNKNILIIKTVKIFAYIYFLCFLFGGFPGIIKENIINISAAGAIKTFAGKIGTVIPMATCTYAASSAACTHCGTGLWDDITILPIFGGGTSVEIYACKMATLIPSGGGTCQINEVIFGPGASNKLTTNDGEMTNIWCQMQ